MDVILCMVNGLITDCVHFELFVTFYPKYLQRREAGLSSIDFFRKNCLKRGEIPFFILKDRPLLYIY